MANQRTIRNKDLEQAKQSTALQPDTVFGVPRQRLPLIVLFFGVTIGSFLMWSLFSRPPILDYYTYELVNRYPHDETSFTQGLIHHQGALYESSGKYGRSSIRKVDLETGEVTKLVPLPDGDKYFGEGLTAVGDRLIQITWQENTGFVYDLDLNLIDQFTYDFHGWGLTFDGKQLIASDGTSKLRFLNPETYEVEREVLVYRGTSKLNEINELEYINGYIYANVLYDDIIYQINPLDGKVVGQINFQGLYPPSQRSDRQAVMNGIAINARTGNLLVTGKYWPELFEVKPKPMNTRK